MKTFLTFITLLFTVVCFSQLDSTEFKINKDLKIKTISLDALSINKNKIETISNDYSYILSIDDKCNLLAPKYSDLNEGEFNFYKLSGDIKTSLSILGSKLSYDKRAEYYTLFFNRYAKVDCNEKSFNYGVGFYVIIQISNLKTKVDIKNIYDISAVGQLNIASLTLDTRHFGLKPEAANIILPNTISKLDVETAKYFDGLLNKIQTTLNDSNTKTMIIPTNL